MRLETDDPEIFEQWMRFAQAQMPFPLFGKDWLVSWYNDFPVPGRRGYSCELQEVKRVPAALKVGDRVRVIDVPTLARSRVGPGDTGIVTNIETHTDPTVGRFGEWYFVQMDRGNAIFVFCREHLEPVSRLESAAPSEPESDARYRKRLVDAAHAGPLASYPRNAIDILYVLKDGAELDAVGVKYNLPRGFASETEGQYRERLLGAVKNAGAIDLGNVPLGFVGILDAWAKTLGVIGSDDEERAKLTHAIDAAAGHVPLPPAKPPVTKLSGPMKHDAAAMPAGALKR